MKSHSILRDGHQIKLLKGGAEFFPELIRALEAARSHVQLETYIFDFKGDLYGQHLSVALVDYLRPELKFDGLPALIAQMDSDCSRARAVLAAA